MTSPAPLPADEDARLARLRALAVLDSAPEALFDAMARTASLVCGTPIAMLSLVDAQRQWFKAVVGLPGVTETPRDVAFCGHAILGETVLEVPDARHDARFASNPLVTGDPNIRFYAGAPLRLGDGSALGTLCVIDRQPRHLTAQQRELLRQLADVAAQALELRARAVAALEAAEVGRQRLEQVYQSTPAMLYCADAESR